MRVPVRVCVSVCVWGKFMLRRHHGQIHAPNDEAAFSCAFFDLPAS